MARHRNDLGWGGAAGGRCLLGERGMASRWRLEFCLRRGVWDFLGLGLLLVGGVG